jgi:hypothetical protein
MGEKTIAFVEKAYDFARQKPGSFYPKQNRFYSERNCWRLERD